MQHSDIFTYEIEVIKPYTHLHEEHNNYRRRFKLQKQILHLLFIVAMAYAITV